MFEVNKVLLQLLKHRKTYAKLRAAVNLRVIDKAAKRIISELDTYYREYPTHAQVIPGTFLQQLGLNNPDLSSDDLSFYSQVVESMMEEPDAESSKGIIRSLKTMEFADQLDAANNSFHVGEDIDLFGAVTDLVKHFEKDVRRSDTVEYISCSLEDLIETPGDSTGLRWRVNQLFGSMPGLKTGQQVIFAARPGRGKTSFCAYNAPIMAAALPNGRPLAWFNNEGKGREIWNTCYRGVLGKSNQEITAAGYKESEAEFNRLLGAEDRVRIFDIHGRDYRFIERVIQNHNPGIIIFDMLDNVHGFADAARTDLRLEALYQWARECAVIYDFLSIPTSQLSVEAEGIQWPDQSMLKDSKTAKQGACDAVVTMGALNKPDRLYNRYLYVPKAFKGTPLKGYREDCLAEVLFDPERCKFTQQ